MCVLCALNGTRCKFINMYFGSHIEYKRARKAAFSENQARHYKLQKRNWHTDVHHVNNLVDTLSIEHTQCQCPVMYLGLFCLRPTVGMKSYSNAQKLVLKFKTSHKLWRDLFKRIWIETRLYMWYSDIKNEGLLRQNYGQTNNEKYIRREFLTYNQDK